MKVVSTYASDPLIKVPPIINQAIANVAVRGRLIDPQSDQVLTT